LRRLGTHSRRGRSEQLNNNHDEIFVIMSIKVGVANGRNKNIEMWEGNIILIR